MHSLSSASLKSATALLERLCRAYGVQTGYVDSEGRPRRAAEEALLAALRALGAPVASAADASEALAFRRREWAARLLPPIISIVEGRSRSVGLRLDGGLAERAARCRIALEDGGGWEWTVDLGAQAVRGVVRVDGGAVAIKAVALPGGGGVGLGGRSGLSGLSGLSGRSGQIGRSNFGATGELSEARGRREAASLNRGGLPAGYHRFSIEIGGAFAESLLIVAPERAYAFHRGDRMTPERVDDRRDAAAAREWGLFLPLHALRAESTWGVGDYGALARLARWAGERGADCVGTLPLLPTFLDEPFDPSPYTPISRLFWSELFIDAAAAPEFARCSEARRLVESEDFRSQISDIRNAPLVDYRRAAALKRRALEPLAREFFASGGDRDPAFARFLDERPLLNEYARFRATVEARREPWTRWPDRRAADFDVGCCIDPAAERFHVYAQWLADRQLAAIAADARDGRSAGLYLDLPLGAHPLGFDAWRFRAEFAADLTVGAPPDPFFDGGQDWSFAPPHPERSRASGHACFIAALRHQLRRARALRVDHVMGLHRLYCIPRGFDATQGVYIRQPAEELYAILALESHRARATIVGEDLGTVPIETRVRMEQRGVRRMFLLPQNSDAGEPSPPAGCVAALNTHDMPTFAALWEGDDLEERLAEGRIDENRAAADREMRRLARARFVEFLRERGYVQSGEAPDRAATLAAALEFLADGPARLAIVNLEDLWGERRAQNRPGPDPTGRNWRGRAALTLEEFSTDPSIRSLLARIDAARARKRD